MNCVQVNLAAKRCGANARQAFAIAGFLGVLLGAFLTPTMTPVLAGDLKLDKPCSELKTTDVTKVDNPACRAISAIYIDEDGKTIYFERLELDSKRLVSGRLVQVVRGCPENDPNCGGACGKPSCTICIGGRCGCLC